MPKESVVQSTVAPTVTEGVIMETHNFTIIASGIDTEADNFADRMFEAGCDDATIAVQKGVIVLEFDRAARTFATALVSAARDVHQAGARIDRIEPDHLVSASDIANRCGLGRAAISHYATGKRGRNFPSPVARVTTESPLWDWVEVSSWLHKESHLPLVEVVRAKLVRELNYVISEEDEYTSSHLTRLLRKQSDEYSELELR